MDVAMGTTWSNCHGSATLSQHGKVTQIRETKEMDGLVGFLHFIRTKSNAPSSLLGLLNVLIGRRIETINGNLVCAGLTWREAANLLKKVRWPKEAVQDLGLDLADLASRDRTRFWFQAIGRSRIDSDEARKAGDLLAAGLLTEGFRVGPSPKNIPHLQFHKKE